ncbi:nicotinate-nucleotide adenylyltransferase [Fusibacter paucivorans]|uniref:Probable nicotinate-nucleotide adenylyltransferase n=1 Tax=Fusibacter paucivorans TaxID=76009 RepID=A0ABS5PQX2_9FIRM|nr:nicotinate-nucleotide adenylyltransferase [Fusibacter paucivorans]MBS7526819.1 nicotinate-nucleotide adenylyltransferase [Fusibacter paucivorans]
MEAAARGKRIGIMGGSFNPIHYGHLMLAEQIRTQYALDKIIFIPVGIAAHKANNLKETRTERFRMTALAIESNPFFEVSDYELKREAVSYSVETVRDLRKSLDASDSLYFITGADAIILLDSWYHSKELSQYVTFVAATRPGVDTEEFEAKIQVLREKLDAKIEMCFIPALAISSTDIRTRVQEGKSIKYLLPESVEAYIYEKGLYRV